MKIEEVLAGYTEETLNQMLAAIQDDRKRMQERDRQLEIEEKEYKLELQRRKFGGLTQVEYMKTISGAWEEDGATYRIPSGGYQCYATVKVDDKVTLQFNFVLYNEMSSIQVYVNYPTRTLGSYYRGDLPKKYLPYLDKVEKVRDRIAILGEMIY